MVLALALLVLLTCFVGPAGADWQNPQPSPAPTMPVLYAPTQAESAIITASHLVRFYLPTAAKANTVQLTYEPVNDVYDDSGIRTILLATTHTPSVEAVGFHEFTMPPLSTAAATLTQVGSVTTATPANGVDIEHRTICMVKFQYTDTSDVVQRGYVDTSTGPSGNSFTGGISIVTFDTQTDTPTLSKPAASTTISQTFDVGFTLPEEAQSGTAQLTITPTTGGSATDSAAPRVVTFATDATFAGAMEITLVALSATQPNTVTSVVPATDLVHDVVYDFSLSYQDQRQNTAATASAASITFDVVTAQPTLHAPLGGSYIKPAFGLSFTLPEAATPGTVKVVINPLAPPVSNVTDAAGQRDIVFESAQVHAAQQYTITMAALSSAATSVTEINSVTPDTDLKHGAIYLLRISYQDLAGNDEAFAAASLLRFDDRTDAPALTAPAAGATVPATFDVAFTLPEDACSGCVQLRFVRTGGTADAHGTHTLVLGSSFESAGDKTLAGLSYDLAAATAATTDIVSKTPTDAGAILVHGAVYTVTVAYSDVATNAEATASSTGVTVDIRTDPPVVNAPATGGSIATSFTISFTLAEAAAAGSVKVTIRPDGGLADTTAFRTLTFATAFEAQGTHSVTIPGALSGAADALSEVASVYPLLPLADPDLDDGTTYSFTFEAADTRGNAAATAATTGVIFAGSATLPPTMTKPAAGGAVSLTDLKVAFTIPEAAAANSLKIRIAPTALGTVADPAAARVILLVDSAFAAGTAHELTLPALSGAAAALSSQLQSVTPATDLVAGVVYDFFVEYQDAVSNPKAEVNATSVTYTGASTLPSSMLLPAAGTSLKDDFVVNFTLPVIALPGSVTLTFTRTGGQSTDAAAARVVTLSSDHETAGSHQIVMQQFSFLATLSGVASVAPATDLVDGAIYRLDFSYQDASAHPAHVVQVADLNFASEYTMPMVVRQPQEDSIMLPTFSVDFTVPELTLPGTAQLLFTRLDGQPDGSGVRTLTFASGVDASGDFAANLTDFSGTQASSLVSSISPQADLVDGTLYQLKFRYQDAAANPAADTNVRSTYVGTATLAPAILFPLAPASAIDIAPIVEAFAFQYTLLEAAAPDTFTLTITPYASSPGPYYDAAAPQGGPSRVLFLRHGQSEANATRRDVPDAPLTELGRAQAGERGEGVRVDRGL